MNRRLTAVIMSILVGVVSALVPVSTASANETAGGHTSSSVENLAIGTYYDLDYSCQSDDPSMVVTGTRWTTAVPDGMTIDQNTAHLIGIPTTVQEIGLSPIWCDVTGPNGAVSLGIAVGTIKVYDPTPPVDPSPRAYIDITPLRDAKCGVQVSIVYPFGIKPDAGSQELTITWGQEGQFSAVFHGVGNDSDVTTVFSGYDLSTIADGEYWSETFEANASVICFDYAHFSITYKVDGVQSLPRGTTFWVDTVPNDQARAFKEITPPAQGGCMLYVEYAFTTQPDYDPLADEDVFLRYTEPGYEVIWRIHSPYVGSRGFFYYSFTYNAVNVLGGNDVTIEAKTGLPPTCQSNGRLEFSFRSFGEPRGSTNGVKGLTPCGRGTVSNTGYQDWDSDCVDVAVGSYADKPGSITPKSCPVGMTTETVGSASMFDCYKPKVQTVRKLTLVKTMKFKDEVLLPLLTDQKITLSLKTNLVCKVTRVKVKKVIYFKITAGKKAGICRVTATAPAALRTLPLKKAVAIKVSKTGK